jgi:hypothetical protein
MMEATVTVTVRRLAHELGIDRRIIKDYCRNRRVGSVHAGHRTLTENEAENVRQELRPRLTLPEPADIERETGQRVYSTVEASKELGICHDTVLAYGHDLGVLVQIRNGLMPSYVITGEGLTRIFEARQEAAERMREMLREQAAGAAQKGGRQSQHRALMREERDYDTGKVRCFLIQPATCHALSSDIPGGPEFRTLQWIPFHPAEDAQPDLDLSVWHVSDHRQHLSLDSMIADGEQI